MAAGLPRPPITLAVLFVLCSALAVPGAITISRGQPRPSVIHHSPRPDHELEMQDAGGAPGGGEVESIVFTAGESPMVYASFSAGAVFRSADLGRTWAPADRGLPQTTPCDWTEIGPAGSILHFALAKTTLTTEFVSASRGNSPELYRSADHGTNWTRAGQGLPDDSALTSIVALPGDPARLFAGTMGRGVFESRDGGATWQPLP